MELLFSVCSFLYAALRSFKVRGTGELACGIYSQRQKFFPFVVGCADFCCVQTQIYLAKIVRIPRRGYSKRQLFLSFTIVRAPFSASDICKTISLCPNKKPIQNVRKKGLRSIVGTKKSGTKPGSRRTFGNKQNGDVCYNCTIIDFHDRSVVASITDLHITSDLTITRNRRHWDHSILQRAG